MAKDVIAAVAVRLAVRIAFAAAFSILIIQQPFGGTLAEPEKGIVASSLLRLEDKTSSHYTIMTGETVTLTGDIRSLVLQDMRVSVDLESNGIEGRDWVVVSRTPRNSFAIPAAESVPYEFEVRFLSPGTFSLDLNAKILEIPNRPTPIDASSPDCSGCRINATIVTVTAPLSSFTSIVVATAVVIAAGGGISVWYFRHRSKQKASP